MSNVGPLPLSNWNAGFVKALGANLTNTEGTLSASGGGGGGGGAVMTTFLPGTLTTTSEPIGLVTSPVAGTIDATSAFSALNAPTGDISCFVIVFNNGAFVGEAGEFTITAGHNVGNFVSSGSNAVGANDQVIFSMSGTPDATASGLAISLVVK